MRENRPKNMPLPDKPLPQHRSPICGKLSPWTEEKGNSIGFCTSQKTHPHNIVHSYLTAPSRTQWKLAWGVSSKRLICTTEKEKTRGTPPERKLLHSEKREWSGYGKVGSRNTHRIYLKYSLRTFLVLFTDRISKFSSHSQDRYCNPGDHVHTYPV